MLSGGKGLVFTSGVVHSVDGGAFFGKFYAKYGSSPHGVVIVCYCF